MELKVHVYNRILKSLYLPRGISFAPIKDGSFVKENTNGSFVIILRSGNKDRTITLDGNLNVDEPEGIERFKALIGSIIEDFRKSLNE